MLKGILIISIIVVLLISSLVGCGGEGAESITPLELVPQRTDMLMSYNLSRIIEDEDVVKRYGEQMKDDEDAPQTWGEALDWVKEETGIDLRKPVELIIFSEMPDVSGLGDFGLNQYNEVPESYAGFIGRCTVDESALVAAIEKQIEAKLSTIDYKGYSIYTIPTGSVGSGFEQAGPIESGFTFIGSDGLVMGTVDVVKDVIDVREGDQAGVSGELIDIYEGLGDAMMKSAAVMPTGFFEQDMPETPSEIPLDLTPFFDIKTVASTMDKQGETISLYEQICFGDSDSAEAVEGLIDLGMMMVKLGGMFEGGFGDMLPDDGGWDMPGTNGWSTPTPGDMPFDLPIPEIPEEVMELLMEVLGDLLDKLEVDTTDACLDIDFEITVTEIEEMVDKISAIDTEDLPDWSWPMTGDGEEAYWTDDEVLQLACLVFYSDTHGGWVEGTPALWGCTDTALTEEPGHYYPTALARPGDHVLSISWTEYDPMNELNQLVCLEDGTTPATDADIDDHAIWMGLLINEADTYTSPTGTSERIDVSVLDNESCWYINEFPESFGTMNGADSPGGMYTWVVGDLGMVYGVYKGTDGNWYWGFNGTYP